MIDSITLYLIFSIYLYICKLYLARRLWYNHSDGAKGSHFAACLCKAKRTCSVHCAMHIALVNLQEHNLVN